MTESWYATDGMQCQVERGTASALQPQLSTFVLAYARVHSTTHVRHSTCDAGGLEQEQLDVQDRKLTWLLGKLDSALPLPADGVDGDEMHT